MNLADIDLQIIQIHMRNYAEQRIPTKINRVNDKR